jgi:Tol biopolymer transport system component
VRPGRPNDSGSGATDSSVQDASTPDVGVDAGVFVGNPTIDRINISNGGTEANGLSLSTDVSYDGRFVAFDSTANNLVSNDTNGSGDVFVRDRQTGTTTRVSVATSGDQGQAGSAFPSISADGRIVAFASSATNFVVDTNGAIDVFAHDTLSGITGRISVASDGSEANAYSISPVVSGNGRFVGFTSQATNLVLGDTTGSPSFDVFVRDRVTGETTRVSVSTTGAESNGNSERVAFSEDGRFVVFSSNADNLVAGDTNGAYDVFLRDRQIGTTSRISVTSASAQANGESLSFGNSVSADGRFIAFASAASNLVPGDTNNRVDVFVRDTLLGLTTRVSVDTSGIQGNGDSDILPSISGDGRFVAFASFATNFASPDTNGFLDCFVHDRSTGATVRVSLSAAGIEPNHHCEEPQLSTSGASIIFRSAAANLVAGDTNTVSDVFAVPNPL